MISVLNLNVYTENIFNLWIIPFPKEIKSYISI